MILHILAILMILGLAYLQMMQGFFSSIIMAVCSIFSAAIAMALFPWFAATTEMYSLQPNIADAVSFSLLFAGSLVGLRYLADKFIRGDIYFDMIIDRVGGALFGLFSGTVMIGALLVVIQLAPFGRVVWGDFRPYNDSLERDKRVAPFMADEFVVGFGEMISAGSMSSGEKLTDLHDNLLREAFCARNTAGRNGGTNVTPGAITGIALYDGDAFAKAMEKTDTPVPEYPLLDRREPSKVVIVRVEINVSAADEGGEHWWRLPATQFRLLCQKGAREKSPESYYPVGYVFYDSEDKNTKVIAAPENADGLIEPAKLILERPKEAGVYGDDKYGKGKISQDKINLTADWVYVLPKSVTPKALFFRRSAAVETPAVGKTFTPSALRDRMLTNPEKKSKKRGKRR